ncbi:MAG TPA: DNA-processing protein DprA [Planctomycetota bacterium]|nr:DNA-processing protein DprA [Planctomycetota bacterium]
MTDLEALVWLNLSGMVGSALLRRLRERAPLGELRRLSRRDLERIPGVGPVTARALLEAPDPGPELELAERRKIAILPCTSPEFPPALRALYDHPLVLYRRGELREEDALAVGIVGSRRCTDYGRRQAARFARELAAQGLTIVSGLARGVDTAAHRGALQARGGRTLAVLGSGLLRIYPPENARLLEDICARGAALSEFPLTSGPRTENFPRRNRLISGLSLGILVVEAAERSGALITADWALEQGRDVFCVPGSVESPLSRGCHRLIQQGAKLAAHPEDVLEEIPAFALESRGGFGGPRPSDPALSPLERAVFRRTGSAPRTAEEIAADARLPGTAVERVLAGLAARGFLREDGEAGYARREDVRPTTPRS